MTLTKLLFVGALAGAIAAASAVSQTASEVRFESGGATYEAIEAMNARAGDYSLKLTMAAKGSGAYLVDVDVSIASLPQRTPVLETRTEGPLLLAALPPGRYEISASFSDVRLGAATQVKRTVVVPRQGLAQAVVYFDTGD